MAPEPGAKRKNKDWIDISLAVGPSTVGWSGLPKIRVDRISDMDKGDLNTVSTLSMCVHTGTHMDAPSHFVLGRPTMDEMPLDVTVGPARVIEVKDPVSVKRAHLEAYSLKPGERLLIKTENSPRRIRGDRFEEDYVYIDEEAARYLAERGVRLVGFDYFAVAGFNAIAGTHQILEEANIWIIEGLDLSEVPPGNYELVCLPLKIAGCDGSPARAIVRPL